MEQLIQNIYVQGGIVMIAVNFIITILKKWVATKYLPFIALALPAVFGVIYASTQSLPIVDTLIQGIVVGVASMGAYDTVKAIQK